MLRLAVLLVAEVAWMERSEIQELVFSPDSALLHLGYVATLVCTNVMWFDLARGGLCCGLYGKKASQAYSI